jgi:hypothetical protein
MRYRIEVSPTRKGFARVHFPGLVISLEAIENAGPVWRVDVGDMMGPEKGSISVRADNSGDAVWRVAQAAVRAVSHLTDNPIAGEIRPGPDAYLSKFPNSR